MKFFGLAILTIFFMKPIHATHLPVSSAVPDVHVTVAFKNAINEFNQLSKSEKKSRIHQVKAFSKKIRQGKLNDAEVESDLALLVILAVLLPPLAVYLKEGQVNSRFWISLILTLIFWLPGVIYSLLVVLNKG